MAIPSNISFESVSYYRNILKHERSLHFTESTPTTFSTTSFTSKPRYRMWPTTTGGFKEPEEIIYLLQNKSSLDEFVSLKCDQGNAMDTYHAELANNKSGLSFFTHFRKLRIFEFKTRDVILKAF